VFAVVFGALLAFAQTNSDDALVRHAELAAAAMRGGQYASAETNYRAVLKLQPGMAEAWMNLGLSCYLQRKYGDAVRALSSGLRIRPEMSNALLFLGLSHFHLNRSEEAAKVLDLYVKLSPADFQGLYFLGLSRLALEQYDAAERALRAARDVDPKNLDVHYHLAQVYLGKARKHPDSASQMWPLYQQATESIAAVDPNSFRIAQLRAGFYEVTGKKSEAVAELEQVLSNDPKVRGLHYTLGCLYLERLQYDKAIEHFRRELQLDSPYPRTWLQLGHSLIAISKPAEALPLLKRAIEIEPKDRGAAWLDQARALRALKQFDAAVQAFQKAIEYGERDASVYYQLANTARRAGLAHVAESALEQFRQLKAQSPSGAREAESATP
jgi:tetratricopeptide (TPR) repeat protein